MAIQLPWGWERFFEELSAFLRYIERQEGTANESFAEYVVERLEVSIRHVSRVNQLLRSFIGREVSSTATHYSVLLAELLQCLRTLCVQWEAYLDQGQFNVASTSYTAPVIHRSVIGRPRLLITQHQLEYLRSMFFSWVQISEILGVSSMTIYRRRQEYGLLNTPTEILSDAELCIIVRSMQAEFPGLGQTMVWGRLRSMGFRVTRERVRSAVYQNDPIQTALRWRGELVRRHPYSVPGPNSLWHMGKLNNYVIKAAAGVFISCLDTLYSP